MIYLILSINLHKDQTTMAIIAVNRDIKRDAITAFVYDMAICDETNCARSDRFLRPSGIMTYT